MNWIEIVSLIAVGVTAGFINTTAGGGSSLNVAMLIFLGLPATVANGTNRVAIFMQNIISVRKFHQEKIINLTTDYRLIIPAAMGSIIGSFIAVDIDEKILKTVIAIVMYAILFTILFNPTVWLKDRATKIIEKPKWWVYVVFFFIGLYGGFIQIGVGFMLIAGVVLTKTGNLVKAIGLRSLIVIFYTVFSILIFYFNDQVDLKAGLILGVGTMIGAYFGARMAIKGGAKLIRYILIVAIFIMSTMLIYQTIRG